MRKLRLAVVLAFFAAATVSPAADFDGDGTGDVAIFREGIWAVRGITRAYFGSGGDIPVAGDYDGGGRDRVAVFKTASGLWAVRDLTRVYFGGEGAEPHPGDYDGDGTDDLAIFREETGLWGVRGITRFYFGASEDTALSPGMAKSRFGLLVTGQFTEYTQGDDGTYREGVAFSYQTADPARNGEIVTVDNVTGLMWASDGSAAGCNRGQAVDWYEAVAFCNTLEFAGFTDWRLPNIRELKSSVDYGTSYPAVNTTYFPNTRSADYWSSTTVDYDPAYAWYVYFNFGGGRTGVNYGFNKNYKRYLRAVRK